MDNNINQKFPLQEKLDISSPEKFIKNTDHFNSLMMRYRCAIREIRTKLEVLNDEFSIKYNRNPISSIKSRIKTPLSIYNKLQRLGYDFTEQNIEEQLNDVAGIRVICSFIDDIYIMAKLLADQDDITVLRIAMDFWASLEHQLRYKKELGSNEQYQMISRELYDCACTITAVDKQMQNIKNLIEEYSELTLR